MNKDKMNKDKMNKEQMIENFTNYHDVKTKTINWCSKMQSEGLLTPEQYDNCVATFKDATTGVLPKEFKTPSTGMERNYSLYNTRSKKLSPKLSNENTNTVMLVTNNGDYMACDTNNELYFTRDINDSTLNQDEFYFTLIPQNNNVYSIMSPYGKYLIANTEWGASFTGTSIGTMASWTVSKVNNKVLFESIQYTDFYLSFKNVEEPLKLIYGKNESVQWLMIAKKETQLNNKYGEYTGVDYIVTKENILTSLKNLNNDKIALENMNKAFSALQINIRDNYEEIEQYMRNRLDYDRKLFDKTSTYYEEKIRDINQNNTLSRVQKNEQINALPNPKGIDLTQQQINTYLSQIAEEKHNYLYVIDTEVNKIENQLIDINKNIEESTSDYNKFLLDIKNEINKAKERIQQNNLIMGRQQDNYEKINEDVAYISNKQDKYETLDEKLKLNLDIVDGYKQQNSLMTKIYPIVIIILILLLIYLIYLTSIKFMDNVYNKY